MRATDCDAVASAGVAVPSMSADSACDELDGGIELRMIDDDAARSDDDVVDDASSCGAANSSASANGSHALVVAWRTSRSATRCSRSCLCVRPGGALCERIKQARDEAAILSRLYLIGAEFVNVNAEASRSWRKRALLHMHQLYFDWLKSFFLKNTYAYRSASDRNVAQCSSKQHWQRRGC